MDENIVDKSIERDADVRQDAGKQAQFKDEMQKHDYERGLVWKDGGLSISQAEAKINMIKDEKIDFGNKPLPITKPDTPMQAKRKILIALGLWKNSVSCVMSQLERDMIERIILNRVVHGKSLQEVAKIERKTVEQIVNLENLGKRYLMDAIMNAKCRGTLAL